MNLHPFRRFFAVDCNFRWRRNRRPPSGILPLFFIYFFYPNFLNTYFLFFFKHRSDPRNPNLNHKQKVLRLCFIIYFLFFLIIPRFKQKPNNTTSQQKEIQQQQTYIQNIRSRFQFDEYAQKQIIQEFQNFERLKRVYLECRELPSK
jgi:hypothetical protein